MGLVAEERVEIGDMHSQAGERERWLEQLRAATLAPAVVTGLVPVVAGAGNRRIFEDGGASLVIEGGQTMNPSVGQIHEAITAVNADSVIVLPNNGNIRLAAEKAAAESTKDVRVIPTESIPEGVVAAFPFEPDVDIDANERAMRDAIVGLSTGEIARASRDATVDGVDVREGDWLGLVDGTGVASGQDFDEVVDVVVGALLEGGRGLLTVLTGEEAPDADALRTQLTAAYPTVEVAVYEGGQPHYPLLLSAE